MKVYDAPNIRNVALVGHGGCGKTSLVSALLFDMGAVNRLGRVDDGTTVTDFDPDEIERKISLQAALAFAEWKKAKINLLDAPGYANFLSEARAALRVADAALVVVDAVAGVEVQTEKVWALRRGVRPRPPHRGQPDGPRAAPPSSARWRSLQAAFGRAAVPVAMPLGEEKALHGRGRPRVREGGRLRRRRERQVPADGRARRAAGGGEDLAREARGDGGGEQRGADGGVLREGNALPGRSSPRGCGGAVAAGQGLPGAARLVAPQRRRPRRPRRDRGPRCPRPRTAARSKGTDPATKAEASRKPAADAPLSAFVFKTLVDPHAGRISLFRVYSGTLKSDSRRPQREPRRRRSAWARCCCSRARPRPRSRRSRPATSARWPSSRTPRPATPWPTRRSPIVYPPVVFPEPATTFAIEPKTRGDEDKISTALHRLHGGGPGPARLARRADPRDAALGHGPAPHRGGGRRACASATRSRSTSRSPRSPTGRRSRARPRRHGRHKKQTGGHGQFGDCRIRMKPLPRGSDFKFVDDIFGGLDPQELHPRRGEGHPGRPPEGLPGRLPDGGLPGRALRRPVPRRRLLGDVLQDRGLARLQGRAWPSAGPPSSSRS